MPSGDDGMRKAELNISTSFGGNQISVPKMKEVNRNRYHFIHVEYNSRTIQ